MEPIRPTILVIDDLADNLITMDALISDIFPEATVLTASNGRNGIELARSSDPHIILLDVIMPGMDGFEVCSILKLDPILQDIPVVFVTALRDDSTNRIKAMEAGADGFLAKPVDASELTVQIKTMTRIKEANLYKKAEKERLSNLVSVRTKQLKMELTERRHTESVLEQEKVFIQGVMENLPGIFMLIDEKGRVIRVNRNLLIETGYSESEIFAISEKDILQWENEDESISLWDGTHSSNLHASVYLITKKGEKRFYLISGFRYNELTGFNAAIIGIDITKEKEHEHKLQSNLNERSILLAEIHHRVKNNLAIVSALLQMEESNLEDEKSRVILTSSVLRIQSMALIHEHLYSSTNFKDVKFKTYLEQLLDHIRHVHDVNGIAIDLDGIQEVFVNVNQAIPAALIVNELVSNGYKHAFKGRETGTIRIGINSDDDHITMVVEDDGVGMDPSHVDTASSMGFTLLNVLSQQLNAEIDVLSELGTRIQVRFPKMDVLGSGGEVFPV